MSKSSSVRRVIAPLLVAIVVLFSLVPAFSTGHTVPTEIRLVQQTLIAGTNATVEVSLSEPGPVVLTSSPAGVVSYSTTISTSSATLSVPVSTSASGPVTVILTSSGSGQQTTIGYVEPEQQGEQGN